MSTRTVREARAFLAGEMGEQALHSASGAGELAREEHEQGPSVFAHVILLVSVGPQIQGEAASSHRTVGANVVSTLDCVGTWYWIGVCAGLGAAIGVLALGVLLDVRIAVPVAVVVAAVVGWLLGDWAGAVAGSVGSVLGALGASPTVRGALARGGTRGGTGLLVGAASLVLAAHLVRAGRSAT